MLQPKILNGINLLCAHWLDNFLFYYNHYSHVSRLQKGKTDIQVTHKGNFPDMRDSVMVENKQ